MERLSIHKFLTQDEVAKIKRRHYMVKDPPGVSKDPLRWFFLFPGYACLQSRDKSLLRRGMRMKLKDYLND